MKIAMFGATGRTGSKFVEKALQEGHEVIALVRSPQKIKDQQGLTIVEGDATNRQAVQSVITQSDAVVSALNVDHHSEMKVAYEIIVEAMMQQPLKRIVSIGTAGILNSRVEQGVLRYRSSESKRKTTYAAEQHEVVYRLFESSNLDWTIVCPTYLPDGERVGTYRVEEDYLPVEGKMISIYDTADAAYDVLQNERFIGKRVGVAY